MAYHVNDMACLQQHNYVIHTSLCAQPNYSPMHVSVSNHWTELTEAFKVVLEAETMLPRRGCHTFRDANVPTAEDHSHPDPCTPANMPQPWPGKPLNKIYHYVKTVSSASCALPPSHMPFSNRSTFAFSWQAHENGVMVT